MATTTNLSLTLVEQSQAQKEVTVNTALSRIDAILNTGVIDRDLTVPPGGPSSGDLYIVGASATGDWATHDNELTWFDQVWHFLSPNQGMTVWVADEAQHVTWNGTSWVAVSGLFASATAYGAVGDGTADDTTAIQDAIDAVSAGGGGIIFLPTGTYRTTSSLTLPANCTLKGEGRVATVLDIDHTGDGIILSASFTAVESLKTQQRDTGTVGSGIRVTANKTHLRDLQCAGGVATSWCIDLDRANITHLENIDIGGPGAEELTGNGIVFRNTDKENFPFNFGDSLLAKIDIELSADNTTGIKFEGPDYVAWANDTSYAVDDFAYDAATATLYVCEAAHTSAASGTFADDRTANPTYWASAGANKINNVLLSQVEVTAGAGGLSGDIGIHLYNSARVTLCHVDLENLSTGVCEEGLQNYGAISENNVYLQVIALNCTDAYTANGQTSRRTFIGGDNFPGSGAVTGINDTDSIFPAGTWLSDTSGGINLRLWNNGGGLLQIDDGATDGSLQFNVSGDNPSIQQSETGGGARLFIGNDSARLTQIAPVLKLPTRTGAPFATDEGTLAVADGSGWDPDSTGTGGLFFRWGGNWVKVAS